jgi:hypothetical protein
MKSTGAGLCLREVDLRKAESIPAPGYLPNPAKGAGKKGGKGGPERPDICNPMGGRIKIIENWVDAALTIPANFYFSAKPAESS